MPFRLQPRLTFDITTSGLVSVISGSRSNVTPFPHPTSLIPALSVRTLLDAVLQKLRLPRGATVIFSAINIAGMFDIARHHGLNVEVVDIDPETLLPPPGELTSAAERTNARLCIIAHLFGSWSLVPDIPDLQRKGVLVISDLAQAYGSASDLTNNDGSDVRLFSFGAIKRKTALGGALGVFASSEFARAVAEVLHSYPRRSDFWFRKRAIKYLMLKALSRPIPYAVLERAFRVLKRDFDTAIGKSARGFGQGTKLENYRWGPPESLLSLLTKRIAEALDEHREESASAFIETLPDDIFLPGKRADIHHHWLIPVCLPNPDNVMLTLRKNGFDATRGATSLMCINKNATPAAAELMETILYLPHPKHLRPDQSAKMLHCLATATSA